MKYGYARVRPGDQNLDLQLDALKKAGCEKIFTERASGARTDRPKLNAMLNKLNEGDVIVIWKLDRLGRSLKHLVELVDQLRRRKTELVSLNDPIDTTTSNGKQSFDVFASLAEFEKDMVRERTTKGLQTARARGRKGGRPKGLSKEAEAKAHAAETLYKEKELSVKKICERLSICKSTLYSYLRHRNVQIGV